MASGTTSISGDKQKEPQSYKWVSERKGATLWGYRCVRPGMEKEAVGL